MPKTKGANYHILDNEPQQWDSIKTYDDNIFAVTLQADKSLKLPAVSAFLRGKAKTEAHRFAQYYIEMMGKYGYEDFDALFPVRIIFLRFRANVNNKNQLQNDAEFSTILVDDLRFTHKYDGRIPLKNNYKSGDKNSFKEFLERHGLYEKIEEFRALGSGVGTRFNPGFTKKKDPFGELDDKESSTKWIKSRDDWSKPMYLVLDIKDVESARSRAYDASSWNVVNADDPGANFIHVYPEFGKDAIHTDWKKEMRTITKIKDLATNVGKFMSRVGIFDGEKDYWRAASIYAANGHNMKNAQEYFDTIKNEEILMSDSKQADHISATWNKNKAGMTVAPIGAWLKPYELEKYGTRFRGIGINTMADLYVEIQEKNKENNIKLPWRDRVNIILRKIGAKGFDARELFRIIHIIRMFGPPFVTIKSQQPGDKNEDTIYYLKNNNMEHPLSSEHHHKYGYGYIIRKALFTACKDCWDYYLSLYQWGISRSDRLKFIHSKWQLRTIITKEVTSKTKGNRNDIIDKIWKELQALKQQPQLKRVDSKQPEEDDFKKQMDRSKFTTMMQEALYKLRLSLFL